MVFRTIPYCTLVAVYFQATNSFVGYPPQTVTTAAIKILPVIWLVLMIWLTAPWIQEEKFETKRKFVILGLAISMLGDISLVWRVKLFIPGLLFFAVAQTCYIKAFGFSPKGYAYGLICTMTAFAMDSHLLPGVTEGPLMKFLVIMYTALIFTMAWRAMVQAFNRPSAATWVGFLGAVSFICSDFMIALTKWRPVPQIQERASFYIMLTYYAAQLGISYSVLLAKPTKRLEQNGKASELHLD